MYLRRNESSFVFHFNQLGKAFGIKYRLPYCTLYTTVYSIDPVLVLGKEESPRGEVSSGRSLLGEENFNIVSHVCGGADGGCGWCWVGVNSLPTYLTSSSS